MLLFLLLTEEVDHVAENLAFDSATNTILWTDSKKKSILKINVDSKTTSLLENPEVEVVHLLEGHRLQGLAIDPCLRYRFNLNKIFILIIND